jgi:hypothetical protein
MSATLLVPAAPAHAAGDLAITGDTTYTLEPEFERIAVDVSFTLTNLRPEVEEDGVLTRFFFDRLRIQIPLDAEEPTALTPAGSALTLRDEIIEGADGEQTERWATVVLAQPIFHRDTASFTLGFVLPGGAPRTESSVRANTAYAAFYARGWGDPGAASVTVIVPDDFDVTVTGADLALTTDGTNSIWKIEEIDAPDAFRALFTARRDAALELTDVRSEELAAAIRSWPGDDEWATWVAETVQAQIPALSDAIGFAPSRDEIDIVEALDPALQGYAGWYVGSDGTIELGEVIDDRVLVHELTHLWFNGALFTERWITEGLAETYAALLVPDGSIPPDRSPDVLFPLNSWSIPVRAPSTDDAVAASEAFGYAQSFTVVDALFAEIGGDAMRRVLRAAAADLTAYPGGDDDPPVTGPDDWRRFLDLLEGTGGSAIATDLFAEYVVESSALPILQDRDAARDRYEALIEQSEPWPVPTVVRGALERWSFTEAASAMNGVDRLLAARGRIEEITGMLGLSPPDDLRQAFIAAVGVDELAAAESIAGTTIETLSVLAAARRDLDAGTGLLGSIGLWGADLESEWRAAAAAFEAADYPAATAAADDLRGRLARAETVGRGRVLLTLLVVLGMVLVVVGIRWRRRST